MTNRLMSEHELQHVTGKKRHSAQLAWFMRHFGITPVQSANGHIIMTWSAFEGLQAKRAGILPSGNVTTERPQLMPIRRVA